MSKNLCAGAAFWTLKFSFVILIFMLTVADSSAVKIRARVCDSIITEDDLRDAVENYIPSGVFHYAIDRSNDAETRRKALNDLIESELLWREAQKRKLTVPDESVEAIVKINLKQFGSEEKMNKALETRGFTLNSLRERIRKSLGIEILLKDLEKESRYSDEELLQYYEKNLPSFRKPDAVFLLHILIKVEPNAHEDEWQEKKKIADQLLAKILAGEDFRSAAYKFSEDSYKYKSGELGFIHRGRLNPRELEDAAFSLEKDEVSSVIKTIYGFHILKAGEKVAGTTKDFAEVKESLKKELDKKRYEEKRGLLIEKMKSDCPPEIISE